MYTTIIDAQQLSENLNTPNWIIVDTRFNLAAPDEGEALHQESHIPGAVYGHLDRDLSSPITPGKTGRHPLPDSQAFCSTLAKWGISNTSQVIVYDNGPGMFAARLWWMLRWLGHEKVAVLNGGWQQWQAHRYPANSKNPAPKTGKFTAKLINTLQASVDEVANGQALLLDARAADRFRGENETIDPVAGHIPGALSAPFMDNLDDNGGFHSAERLRQRFQKLLGQYQPHQTIHYCGSGVTAAHNLLAMEIAGLTGSRLYAGSWSHWITDPARGVEK